MKIQELKLKLVIIKSDIENCIVVNINELFDS